MAGKQAEITTREKAAVIYHIVTGEPWTECYKIASRESFEKVNNSRYLSRYSTSWKQSHKIQVYAEEIAAILDNKRKKEINEAIEKESRKRGEDSESNQNRKKNDPDIIDYSDPQNRQRLYNEIIATAKDDPKTRLDAAKVFEQVQRDDREAAKAQKQSRVYLPLTCHDCPLYNKAKKKPTK